VNDLSEGSSKGKLRFTATFGLEWSTATNELLDRKNHIFEGK